MPAGRGCSRSSTPPRRRRSRGPNRGPSTASRARRGRVASTTGAGTADTLRLMVTVRVDADLCVGHGRCYVLAPDVFGADEFGHCIVLEEKPADALESQARIGAENCPE